MMPLQRKELLAALAVVLLTVAAFVLPAMPQPAQYHRFADQRTLWNVPRAMDTLSNLGFLVLGIWGLVATARGRLQFFSPALRTAAVVFHLGLVATAAASAYYHLAPDDVRLAWDRAGMCMVFAGALGMAGTQRISDRAGLGLSAGTLLLGWASLLHWLASGSIAPYAVLQFGGVMLVLLLLVFEARGLGPRWGALLAAYALSKVFEHADVAVFQTTGGWVSGHSLKHLFAASAALAVIVPLGRPASRPGVRLPAHI